MFLVTTATDKRPDPFRAVLSFLWQHWRRHPWLLAAAMAGMLVATAADILVPVFAGALVEALARAGETGREAALAAALRALLALTGLGLLVLAGRLAGILGVIALTLRGMQAAGAEAFHRVQRFSAEWHANAFAGATVRRISRGMWAIDLLNDTLLIALLPSAVVLLGATLLLGWRWPLMGALVALGGLAYVALTLGLALRWVAPAARLSNGWDTRLGGAMADAVGANAVVKAFGAEAREDARLGAILEKWHRRTRRSWHRGTASEALLISALLLLRIAVLGTALWLWWRAEASAGDLATVLTMFFMVQGYLRDVGYHISNLQRGVNEMEELVALQATPLGIADRPDARPLQVTQGAIAFEQVSFRYGGHPTPLYRDLSLTIRAGESVGLVGPSGSGKTTLVKLIQRLHDVTEGRITIDGQDAPGQPGLAAAADRDRAAGAGAVPPLHRGEHRLCAAGGDHGRDPPRRGAGQCGRVHRPAAAGLRYLGRGARGEAFGRGAAARGAGPRLPGRCADPHPGRGDLGAGFRERGGDPGGDGAAAAGAHRHRHRP